MTVIDKVAPRAVAAINRVLKKAMGRFGLRAIAVKPGPDHAGDPAIYIHVDYDLSPTPLDNKVVLRAEDEIGRLLLAMNEDRFPHFRHHFHEAQKVVGDR